MDYGACGYTSHTPSPATVLHVYAQINHVPSPPAFQLAICGECFELGKALSAFAETNLAAVLDHPARLMQQTLYRQAVMLPAHHGKPAATLIETLPGSTPIRITET